MLNLGGFNNYPKMAPDSGSGGNSGDSNYGVKKTVGMNTYYDMSKVTPNALNNQYQRYDNTRELEGIQHNPNELKTINFKQDYIVIIRKKLYYAANMKSEEQYLRVYQVNNFLRISTSHNVYGRPGSCNISIKGGERVTCAERDSMDVNNDDQTKHDWIKWEDMLTGWLSVDESQDSWKIGKDNWDLENSAGIDFKNLLKTREAKYGWRFAEKCDWEPMDEIYVFGKSKNPEYRNKSNNEYKFLPIFFGYIDSVQKTYQAGDGGLLINIQARDHLKLLELSKVMNYPTLIPGMFANGGIDIKFPQDEFGLFIVNEAMLNIPQNATPDQKNSNDPEYVTFQYTNVFSGMRPYEIIKKLASDAGVPEKYLTKRIEKIQTVPFLPTLRGNNTGDLMNAEFKRRIDVCKEAAEKLFLEFYADEEGNIVLKIPNYVAGANKLLLNNLNNKELNTMANGNLINKIGYKVDLSQQLKDATDKNTKYIKGPTLSKLTDQYIHEIKPEYIISFTLTDTDSEIFNMFEIQMEGILDMNFDQGVEAIRRVVPDFDSIIKFGLRPHPGVYTTPLISNRLEAQYFGIMMICKSLANRYSGSLTMIEDSSIKIGDPVRFMMYDEHPMKETGAFDKSLYPAQTVFYVTGIERSINVKNVSYMTLQLKAGRMMGQESIYDIMLPLYKYYYDEIKPDLTNIQVGFEQYATTKVTTKKP